MTTQEEIKTLALAREQLFMNGIHSKEEQDSYLANREAFDTALYLLDKYDMKAPDVDYRCPSCRSMILKYTTYCPDCGQRIDWSDID